MSDGPRSRDRGVEGRPSRQLVPGSSPGTAAGNTTLRKRPRSSGPQVLEMESVDVGSVISKILLFCPLTLIIAITGR